MTRRPILAIAAALFAMPTASAAEAPRFFARNDALPFSEAVQAGPLLYLSGQVAGAGDGKSVIPGGIVAEAKAVMDGIGATLRRRALDYDSLVKCTILLADMKDWPAFNRIYAGYFKPGHYPARAALGTSGLAYGAKVEVECVAWIGDSAK